MLDAGSKIEAAEHHRVSSILKEAQSKPWSQLVDGYARWLSEQKLSTKTIRMYLAIAATACKEARLCAEKPIDAPRLSIFIRKHPGSRANLSRWVTYCRDVVGWRLEMPERASARNASSTLVARFSTIKTRVEEIGVERASESLLRQLIAEAFGLSKKTLSRNNLTLKCLDGELFLETAGEMFRVPPELQSAVKAWDACTSEADC